MVFSAGSIYLHIFIRGNDILVGLHECLVLFFLHFLEHLLVVGQSPLGDYLADLSLYPSSYHAVYRVLLALNDFLLGFFFVVGVYFGMEGKLLDGFLVLYL